MLRYFLYQVKINRPKGANWKQIRFYPAWKKSLAPGFSNFKSKIPWLTFEAIDFLNKHLNKEHIVFEYGGGGSTLFFIEKNIRTITVEHNKEWFEILRTKIAKENNDLWEGHFIEAEKGNLTYEPEIANPLHYSSADENSSGLNFKNYASFIDRYPYNYFDAVIIDGRSRPSCIMHSVNRIKGGGFLVLDNSEREYYHTHLNNLLKNNFNIVLNSAGPSPASRQFTITSIWKKND